MHEWFWRETFPLRPLSEMIETYHHSVGNNGVLELDFAIDDTGNVHPTHAAEYKVHGAAGGGRAGGQVADGRRWAQAWRSLESCFLLFLSSLVASLSCFFCCFCCCFCLLCAIRLCLVAAGYLCLCVCGVRSVCGYGTHRQIRDYYYNKAEEEKKSAELKS